MTNVFDVTEYGAIPDGATDSTAAFQMAIDKAGEVRGAVVVPPGVYVCSTLYMKPDICMAGFSGWGYRETGGAVIRLRDGDCACLIDMSGAFGARIRDIQLLGNHCRGKNIHGVYVRWEDQKSRLSDDPAREDNCLPERCQIGFREDSVTIENCYIKNFSGDAVHLERIWAFTVRNSMMVANKGNAIYINGWDGWITDCIMHTNHGAGIYTDVTCAAVTITGNRIEWNRNGGINLVDSNLLNLTGNYFDRSYGPALMLRGIKNDCHNITATGNIFNRSGKPCNGVHADKYHSSHVYLDTCNNITLTGNTFVTGKDDFGEEGGYGPDYGVVYRKLKSCVITGNTLYNGALKEKFVDLGEHVGEIYICGNAGE